MRGNGCGFHSEPATAAIRVPSAETVTAVQKMEFPKFKGKPDEWLKEVHTQCILNNVKNEKDILRLCKLNVGPAITLPGEINSLAELWRFLCV